MSDPTTIPAPPPCAAPLVRIRTLEAVDREVPASIRIITVNYTTETVQIANKVLALGQGMDLADNIGDLLLVDTSKTRENPERTVDAMTVGTVTFPPVKARIAKTGETLTGITIEGDATMSLNLAHSVQEALYLIFTGLDDGSDDDVFVIEPVDLGEPS